MKTDKVTKVLLALIALGLWLNTLAPLFHPARVVKAAEPLSCNGTVKVNAFGATEAIVGGYAVSLTCN